LWVLALLLRPSPNLQGASAPLFNFKEIWLCKQMY